MSGWTALVHPSLRKKKKWKHKKPSHLPWNLWECYPPQADTDFHTLQTFAYAPACTHTCKHKHELKQTEEARTRCLCVSLDCILLALAAPASCFVYLWAKLFVLWSKWKANTPAPPVMCEHAGNVPPLSPQSSWTRWLLRTDGGCSFPPEHDGLFKTSMKGLLSRIYYPDRLTVIQPWGAERSDQYQFLNETLPSAQKSNLMSLFARCL